MRYIFTIIIILLVVALYCCVISGAEADEQSQRMFEEYQKRKFEKK